VEEKPSIKPPVEMQAETWDDEFVAGLRERFEGTILEAASYRGDRFLVVTPSVVVELALHLQQSGFNFLVDLTAVDYPKKESRFELIYILAKFGESERIRIKTRLPDGAAIATLTTVYEGANWMEREIFDMFGIRFDGHPDLRRILLPDEWTGHPLRKDYGITEMDEAWVKSNLGIESGH